MSRYRIAQIIFGFIFVVSLLWLFLSFFPRERPISTSGEEGVALTVEASTDSTATPIPTATAVPITPTPTSTITGAESSETAVYVVVPGDTLNSIARSFDVTVDEILEENKFAINPDQLAVGQLLEIPSSEEDEAEGVPTATATADAVFLLVATVEKLETAVSATSEALATQVSQINSTVEALATSVAEANQSELENEREDCTNSDKSFFQKVECWMGEYVIPVLGLVSSSLGLVGSIFIEKKEKNKPQTAEERRAEEMRWELLKMEAELKRLELMKARRDLEEDELEQG